MKFKLIIISILTALATSAAVPTDTLTASRVFAEAPLEIIDLLRPSTRLDMIDYYVQADSIFSAPDALGGKSRIEVLTDDYMRVAVTPVSTLEIKILPFKKSFIAMTLYTVGGDSIAADTEVAFYDAELRPLNRNRFLAGSVGYSFFDIKDSDITSADLHEWLPFVTVVYTTGPDNTPLTATLTTLRALPTETRERLEKVMTPSKTAIWQSGKFKF